MNYIYYNEYKGKILDWDNLNNEQKQVALLGHREFYDRYIKEYIKEYKKQNINYKINNKKYFKEIKSMLNDLKIKYKDIKTFEVIFYVDITEYTKYGQYIVYLKNITFESEFKKEKTKIEKIKNKIEKYQIKLYDVNDAYYSTDDIDIINITKIKQNRYEQAIKNLNKKLKLYLTR